MRGHKWLHRIGLITILLGAEGAGDLVAPLPSGAAALGSEALPIVRLFDVDGGGGVSFSFTVVRGGTNCTSSPAPPAGFQCYSIQNITANSPTFQVFLNQRWRVANVSSTNRARVLTKDSDNATDNMYLTGIAITPNISTANPVSVNTVSPSCTFPPTSGATCQRAHITVQKTFNLGNGNAGFNPINPATGTPLPFYWAVHTGGNFNAPDFSENSVLNRMRVTTSACFSALSCNPDTAADRRSVGTIDTGSISTPISGGSQGNLSRDTGPTQFLTGCNTGGTGRCQQTVKYDYEFTIRGFDTMNLTDSVSGCGGTCIPGFTGTSQIPPCGDPNTPPNLDPNAGRPPLLWQCAQQLLRDEAADLGEPGGEIAETCEGTCLVILLQGPSPQASAGAGPFTFRVAGDGLCSTSPCEFTMTLGNEGVQAKVFTKLTPQPSAGDRSFIITGFPQGSSANNYQLDQVTFSTEKASTGVVLLDPNGPVNFGAKVTKLDEDDVFVITMHVH